MKQSKLESWLEQFFNVGSGFLLSFLVWDWIVRPLIIAGWLTIESTLAITTIFTIISIARGYFWRRTFNKGVHKTVHRWVNKLLGKKSFEDQWIESAADEIRREIDNEILDNIRKLDGDNNK